MKEKLYDHLSKYTTKGNIVWKKTLFNSKEYFKAFARDSEILIFNNQYNLLFSDKDYCFYRLNINDFDDFVKITDKESLIKSEKGVEFLSKLGELNKRKYI